MDFDYKAIVAYDSKRGIGKDMTIPWYLPEDLKRMKELTKGQDLIMGSKTFQTIIDESGKPLPNRKHIVLSKKLNHLNYENTFLFNDIEDVKKQFTNAWIFGGSYIYDLFLPYTKQIYATEIDNDYNCDTFFPNIDLNDWKISEVEQREGFKFVLYIRK
jgi:dihydrofolate reductase